MSRLTRLFFPSGAFAGLAVLLLLTGFSQDVLYRFATNILLIVSILGLFFPLRFGVSRQLFTILMLIGLGLVAPFFIPPETASATPLARYYYCLTAALVPLHCALFAWWRERGLVNIWGGARITWLAFMPVLVIFIGTFPEIIQHPGFSDYFLYRNIAGIEHLPLVPVGVCAVSGLFILLMYVRDSAPNYEGFFWVLVIMATGFFTRFALPFFQLTASIAIVAMLLSMIEAGLFFAYRDELTTLPSRRALNANLQKLGSKYTIAMIDVDHFKRFNDSYGHDVGDEVLKMVATRLQKSSGKAYRYGGEEFTLIYPGKSADQATADADSVRELIQDSDFTIRKPLRKKGEDAPPEKVKQGKRQVVSVTVSIGLAQRSERHVTPEEVLKAADKALYKAKKNGRNRVAMST